MTKTEIQKEWKARIVAYRSSGKTQAAWCAENNASHRQLSYWLRKEKSASTPDTPVWLPVEIKQQEISSPLVIKIGVATVEVNLGFNRELLLEVVKTLQSL